MESQPDRSVDPHATLSFPQAQPDGPNPDAREAGIGNGTATGTGSTRRVVLALAGLLAGGRAALAAPEPDASQPLRESAQARLTLAQEALKAVRANIGRGMFGPGERDPIAIWSRRRLEARLDLSRSRTDRRAAAQEHLDEMKAVEQHVQRMHRAGQVDQLSLMDAQYRRLEAQSALDKENATA